MTRTAEQSLRYAMEKWLGFKPSETARIAAYGRTASGSRRYVGVETMHDGERLALFFLRHDDGCWRVFPPIPAMPEMAFERLAA
jgi:hypothetical protein